MPSKIFVAYDRSDTADRALAWAIEEQQRSGCALRVVEVFDPNPLETAVLPVPPAVTDAALREARDELAKSVAARGATASVDLLLARRPGPALLEAAQQWGADLIVVGTHGRTGIARVVLGSIAEYLVRHADCAVVSLRGGPEQREVAVPGLL